MKLAVLAALAVGCGGHANAPVAPVAAVPVPAARWVPEKPTYVFASPTLRDAQRALRDAIDLIGPAAGFDVRDAARAIAQVLAVDALNADPLAEIGVDVRASWAVFSEALSPTVVVRLAAPEQMAAFLDRQRERGLVTQSRIVDGTEVFSATLPGGVRLAWAIAGEWMWLHVALSPGDDGISWFTASHAPHRAAWTADWAWAQRAAGTAADVVGFLDLHGAVAGAVAKLPDAVACTRLAAPIGRAAVSLDGDDHGVSARFAVDVGSTAGIRALIVPPPSGWDATAARAAIAVQWNLDLAAVRAALAPCLNVAGVPLARLDAFGVRTARGMLLGFDPDAMSGSGAVVLDVSDASFLERQLDRIPLRRTIQRARTFGRHKGYAIAIPFSVTVEYVLEPTLAMIALGEGVLARIAAPAAAPPGPPPIFALEVAPPALSPAAWEAVLRLVAEQALSSSTSAPVTRQVVDQMRHWRAGRIAITAEGNELVFTASGRR